MLGFLLASQKASIHDSLDCFPTKNVWSSKARCSGYHVSFICFGNISSQGGDTLNLVSGRRLEKHNHHPPKKQELLPNGLLKGLSSVSPIRPFFFWWWLWCGVQEVENRRGRKIFVVPFNHWSWTINFPRENENVTHGLIKSFPRQVRLPNTVN